MGHMGEFIMITYYIEDLDISDLNALIEKGVCFDVQSKTSVLSCDSCRGLHDEVRADRDKSATDL